ncbi:MAG: 2-amino-4-hydroxy-6-hydroxymethyldihydropteridine diphosphokinase [Paramuribaculum sp.]|nr:2-amino-4-hydroxy-6-hydroxymethyldihydropteridine diphosphokinase [Paramuribaculum sp.]
MHEAIVCVASNTDEWEVLIEAFKARVVGEVDATATFSPIYSTLSITDGITPYNNMVGRILCSMGFEELNGLMKQWEGEAGRIPRSKSVPLDIDIVIFDGRVVRPRDYSQEYFLSGYRALDHDRSRREI